MKKFVVVVVLMLIAERTSSVGQEIRLDSLWAKQGGVFAMSFSPDSKTLVIGEDGDEGQIRIFEAQTGKELDSIAHSFYVDLAFTPDGKKLLAIDQTGIKIFNGTTYKYERTISYNQGGLIAFSPDESKLALAGDSWIAIVDIQKGEVLTKLTRPDSYVPDPKHPTTTNPYWNGKVSFSADGKYIIGKYENSLVRWDWQNASTKPEILIGSFGNRAIIGFSPDKKYLVQQSNYLWDIEKKKQVAIEGMDAVYHETNDHMAFSIDNKYMICVNDRLQLTIVSLAQMKVIYNTEKGADEMVISNDNLYLSYLGVGGRVRTYRIDWDASSVESEQSNMPMLVLKPQPGKETITLEVVAPQSYKDCEIVVISSLGTRVKYIYNGSIPTGKQTYYLPTTGISSGQYSVVMSYNGKIVSVPFIISK